MVKDSTIQLQAAAEEKSNLNCASGEATASVSSCNRNDSSGMYPTHNLPLLNQNQPPKKKRNQPGHPDPGAEVVSLSPRTLMATNRFVCEICSKGFQRDQNLQLHRRGHNLPWKLKQRTTKEVRRKVYVCPETSCVHHDPSRALGDLTGIKKHFSRKHGEKKWKCEKCSKRYAVQSDWKAHSKTCGTKEYRCDCGTLFTRRDSFITHRAFCDALVQESTRSVILTTNNTINPLQSDHVSVTSHHQQLHSHFNQVPIKKEQPNFSTGQIPPWLSSPPIIGPGPQPIDLTTSSSLVFQYFQQNHDDHQFSQDDQNQNKNQNPNPICTSTLPPYNSHPHAHLSATALLQKAASQQMGAKSSTESSGEFISAGPHQSGHVSGFGVNLSSRDEFIRSSLACYGNKAAVSVRGGGGSTETAGHVSELGTNSPNLFHDMMMMMMMNNNPHHGFDQGSTFDDNINAFDGILNHGTSKKEDENFHATFGHQLISSKSSGGNPDEGDGMTTTRDFLGLSQSDDLLGLNNCLDCNENQNHNACQD